MSLHQHNQYIQYVPVMQQYVPPQSPAQPPQQQQTLQSPQPASAATVAPNDTYTREAHISNTNQNQAQTQNQNQQTPLVAQGDWTKNLVHLAKTAELK